MRQPTLLFPSLALLGSACGSSRVHRMALLLCCSPRPKVDRLVVANKADVRIFTKDSGDVSGQAQDIVSLFCPPLPSPSAPKPRLTSGLGDTQPHTAVATFSIGSVESFERSLDQAQRELGTPPSEMIPVTYINETSIMYAGCCSASSALSPLTFWAGMPPFPAVDRLGTGASCSSLHRRCSWWAS